MKAAVVGLGVIGSVHMEVLEALGNEVAAVCDTDPARLSAYPHIAGYTDYAEMLHAVRPDVVHICTPHHEHARMVVEALKRDIHVLCEKPLCINAEEIEQVLAAERASKALLGVCHQNRYNPANLYVKELIAGKQVTDGTGMVVWNRDKSYYEASPWRAKKETAGGGVLINQALHTLDLLQWYAGEPRFVIARASNLALDDIEVEDTLSAVFSGGADFTFFATNCAAQGFPVEVTLRTKEHLIKLLPNAVLVDDEAISFEKDTRFYGKQCYGTGHERLFADFYRCIREGKRFAIDGAEGAKVIRLILGAYASNGKKVLC